MKKILLVLLLLISFLGLSGCRVEIPEGDIKEFVLNLDYDRAYNYAQTAKVVITSTYYVDDVVDGQVSTTTTFENNDKTKYYYSNTIVIGSYIGEEEGKYPYSHQEILTYVNEDDTISSFKKTDDKLEDIVYTIDDVNKSIDNVFFLKLVAGYHSEGIYYGDYIYANCGKYYVCFSLSEDKKILSYNVNTSSINSNGDEIISMHSFSVNEYGLIETLSSKALYLAENIIIHTTISCEYNLKVDKIKNLL